jgi:hypothetical protein
VAKEEGDNEQTRVNEDHMVKMEQLGDTYVCSLPPPGSPRPRRQALFPVPSPSVGTNGSTKSGRRSESEEGNGKGVSSKSTLSQRNGTGKGERRAISVLAYSLTRVESFDLLCLALGLLLNWVSGGGIGMEEDVVSEGKGRVGELFYSIFLIPLAAEF